MDFTLEHIRSILLTDQSIECSSVCDKKKSQRDPFRKKVSPNFRATRMNG